MSLEALFYSAVKLLIGGQMELRNFNNIASYGYIPYARAARSSAQCIDKWGMDGPRRHHRSVRRRDS
eukprot:scaffold202076_cov50-Prasinocladus_malaysianus.AAC.1